MKVFSASADEWLSGAIEEIDDGEGQVRYNADGEDRLKWVTLSNAQEVKADDGAAAATNPMQISVAKGGRVKVFSASANVWLSGVVEQVEDGEVEVRYSADGEDRLKWVPLDDPDQVNIDADGDAATGTGAAVLDRAEPWSGAAGAGPALVVSKGDRVKVFSASANQWIAGTVEELDSATAEAQVRYSADGTDRLKWVSLTDPQQVAVDEDVSMDTLEEGDEGSEEQEEDEDSSGNEKKPGLNVTAGDKVKVYSASAEAWLAGVVEEVSRQTEEAHVRYKAGGEDRLKWVTLSDPQQVKADDGDGATSAVEVVSMANGSRVKVFSASANEWLSGVVEQVVDGEGEVRYKVGGEDRLKWVTLSDSAQVKSDPGDAPEHSLYDQADPEIDSSTEEEADTDEDEDVGEGTMGDRIDDALGPSFQDLEVMQALLTEIHETNFHHPATDSLEEKCAGLRSAELARLQAQAARLKQAPVAGGGESKEGATAAACKWLAEKGHAEAVGQTACSALDAAEIPFGEWLQELHSMDSEGEGKLDAFIGTLKHLSAQPELEPEPAGRQQADIDEKALADILAKKAEAEVAMAKQKAGEGWKRRMSITR